jgi:hypothetical protein
VSFGASLIVVVTANIADIDIQAVAMMPPEPADILTSMGIAIVGLVAFGLTLRVAHGRLRRPSAVRAEPLAPDRMGYEALAFVLELRRRIVGADDFLALTRPYRPPSHAEADGSPRDQGR